MELKSKKLQNKAVYDQKLNDANKKIFFSIYKNVRDNKKKLLQMRFRKNY